MPVSQPGAHRTVLSGKIHRATVIRADLHHVGSLTIDQDLVEAAADNRIVALGADPAAPVPGALDQLSSR